MVDALREARRVLRATGVVIDIRPITAPVQIEAWTPALTAHAVEVDSYVAAEDDRGADNAVKQALSSGWFEFVQTRQFAFEVNCDSATDLKAFAETGRRLREAKIPYEDLEIERTKIGEITGQVARLRCYRPSKLSVYRATRQR